MTGPAALFEVPVLDAWDETATLRAVRLAFPPALARAHERVGEVVKIGTEEGEAFFALASAPGEAEAELLVKRGGRVADSVVARARAGRALACTAPFGQGFPLEEAAGRDVLLFAAGSGIAPIRAVVQAIRRERARYARVILFHGQRRHDDFAYRREHPAWEADLVKVVLCPTAEDDPWTGVRGRVQEVAAATGLGGARPTEAIAFVAGMTAMVEDVRRTLAGAGVPPERVHANF
ncbi:MAG: oxidoreductase [Anaeromyxobacter sp.]